ncbi:MAG: hypothetical protein A2046_04435 [Bacteroidetes bacterium GWA2_30_7]|nr:MAG: hypothetical protein A2046_04435 [Bacteroidetes bacterium GWA2_30_7]
MQIKDHLILRTIFSDRDEEIITEINDKILNSSITPKRIENYMIQIIELLHKGLKIDTVQFINNIFFDFYIIRENIIPHKTRIYKLLVDIGKYEENSLDEQTHLINTYRNIVSDLFDPYINLLVATIQFIEGTFISMQETNLGLGERNKYEFVKSRLNKTNLLEGYSPIVRNAISHTGTEGIIYENNEIIFRNIKRGTPPKIDIEKWTNETLRIKTLELMDFIHAIDNCIEIIGFDTTEIIKANNSLSTKFLDEIISKEQRFGILDDLDNKIKKIVNFKAFDNKTKLNLLSQIFFSECKKRKIEIKSIRFNDELKLVCIEVPWTQIDTSNDTEIINKSLNLIRYGTIAIILYKFNYNKYLIGEPKEVDKDFIAVEIDGKDLEEYVKEEIGLYDLLNDNKIFINNKKIEVSVDFDKLKELEYLSTERRFPKKKR